MTSAAKVRPEVHVVIVTWNDQAIIDECLDALSRSRGVGLHVSVVDNDSSDGTRERLQARGASIDTLFLDGNVGFPKACNIGARRSGEPFVLMLNPDVVVEPDTVAACVAKARAEQTIGLVGSRLVYPDGTVQDECARELPSLWTMLVESMYLHVLFPRSWLFDKARMRYWDHGDSRLVPCITGAFMLLPRRVWDELGGFDESIFMYYEDIDLCARVGEMGLRVWYEADATAVHHSGVSSAQADRDLGLLYGDTFVTFFRRHRGERRLGSLWLSWSGGRCSVLRPRPSSSCGCASGRWASP